MCSQLRMLSFACSSAKTRRSTQHANSTRLVNTIRQPSLCLCVCVRACVCVCSGHVLRGKSTRLVNTTVNLSPLPKLCRLREALERSLELTQDALHKMKLSDLDFDSYIRVGAVYYRPCPRNSGDYGGGGGGGAGGEGGGGGGGNGPVADAEEVGSGMTPREVADVVEHLKWVLEQTDLDLCEVLLRYSSRNRHQGGACLLPASRDLQHADSDLWVLIVGSSVPVHRFQGRRTWQAPVKG